MVYYLFKILRNGRFHENTDREKLKIIHYCFLNHCPPPLPTDASRAHTTTQNWSVSQRYTEHIKEEVKFMIVSKRQAQIKRSDNRTDRSMCSERGFHNNQTVISY
jgi:hypothetical protein